MRHYPTVKCGPTLTKASHLEECDVNNIVRRYDAEGVLTHLRQDQGHYSDVSEMPSYRAALDQINQAKLTFAKLPHEARAAFDNDPAQYVDFLAQADESDLKAFNALLTAKDTPPTPSHTPEAPKASESSAEPNNDT